MEDIEQILSAGASRAILGTSAVRKPELVKEALSKYPDKIVVGIDAKDGMVAIEGWEQVSSYTAVDFAKAWSNLAAV